MSSIFMTFNQKLNNGQLLTTGHGLRTALFGPCQEILLIYKNIFPVISNLPFLALQSWTIVYIV